MKEGKGKILLFLFQVKQNISKRLLTVKGEERNWKKDEKKKKKKKSGKILANFREYFTEFYVNYCKFPFLKKILMNN